jgi:hypothetical protein
VAGLVSSTNKTDRHHITEILLKVALTPEPFILVNNKEPLHGTALSDLCP